jgi:hypothetical protein
MLIVQNYLIKMKILLLIIYYFFFNLGEKTVEAAPIQGAFNSTRITFLRLSRNAKMAAVFAVKKYELLSDNVI